MSKGILLEVCVDSMESGMAAERGGAHRIELCSDLPSGGVTPSSGMIAAVRQKVSLALHVMIRPRSGDFCYSDDEFQIMQQDVAAAKQLGADGVVLGILDLEGNVDVKRTRRLVELAEPLKVTFHRAFDMSRDLFRPLHDVQTTGVHCILTSGGRQSAAEGAKTLQALVEAAKGRIAIMAGSGVNDHNVAALIARSGVREIHASLTSPVASAMRYQKEELTMGAAKGREYKRLVVDEEKVRRLLQAASSGNTEPEGS
jgi:copper homeostasis protein